MDYKVALPSAIQKYEKVKNKRHLNSVTYSTVQRFTSILGLWGNIRGLLFILQLQYIILKCICNSSGFEITIEHPHTDVVKCTQLVRGQ